MIRTTCIPQKASPLRAVTVSIGVAVLSPQDGGTFADLVAKADRGLYQAKEAGRNTVAAGAVESAEIVRVA